LAILKIKNAIKFIVVDLSSKTSHLWGHMYTYMYTHAYNVYVYIHMYMRTYMYMYTHAYNVYVYIHTYMRTYMYMYAHRYISYNQMMKSSFFLLCSFENNTHLTNVSLLILA